MDMLRITLVLVTAMACTSCARGPRTDAVPAVPSGGAVAVVEPDSPQQHPADHPLRVVPILIGMPSKEMTDEMRAGKALLGGCVPPPGGPPEAKVCERCRTWKTDAMKYWQSLPKEFGELAAKNGG